MTPEIFSKIMRLLDRSEERLIIVDASLETPLVLLKLDDYEKIKGAVRSVTSADLTAKTGSDILNPELAVLAEAGKSGKEDWGGTGESGGDQYYLEPTE